jgi:hypothetical protein
MYMENSSRNIPFLIVLIIIFALVAIYEGAYIYILKQAPVVTDNLVESSVVATTTLEKEIVEGDIYNSYKSRVTGLSFEYPRGWRLGRVADFVPGEDFAYHYELNKSAGLGNVGLTLSFNEGIDGVGGACPDYDPKSSVVASKQVVIGGRTFYVIYSGNKATNFIKYAYLSGSATGECPNVAYVELPGDEFLFSARLTANQVGNGSQVDISSSNTFSEKDFEEAEKILSSITRK